MSFAHVVEHMAAALAFAQRERNEPTVDLRYFDCAQPLAESYLSVTKGHVYDQGIFRDVDLRALGAPVAYALLCDAGDDRDHWAGYAMFGARQLGFADLRGIRIPFVSPAHCRASLAHITPKGTYAGGWRYCSWHARERRWLTWGPSHGPRADAFSERMWLLLGFQFAARYYWHVEIAFPKAPRIAIPCTSEEARALFKARDVPDGKQRRAALRHWVHEYYRNQPPVRVRAHLRGAEAFTWEHMECTLRVSPFDRERAAEYERPATT